MYDVNLKNILRSQGFVERIFWMLYDVNIVLWNHGFVEQIFWTVYESTLHEAPLYES